jgi:hypothetical protein
MKMAKVYQAIASKIEAMRNCNKSGNGEWFTRHHDAIDNIVKEYMPSGSGVDSGTQFDTCEHVDCNRDRLIFTTAFHHMDEHGGYDGWTQHSVIVTPSLARGFDIKVTGSDRNGIEDYLADLFYDALNRVVD